MTDYISRADAIELFEKYKPRMAVSVYEYGQALKTLPSAELPKGDLISRDDAIEAVIAQRHKAELSDYNFALGLAEDAIRHLPSAEAVQGWIPCSERLPKRDELVLVTYKTTDRIHLCKYIDDGSENPWWSYIDDCCAWNNVVLAWMPLPKPYREEREDYELATEQMEHDAMYEPTYNPEDGSM